LATRVFELARELGVTSKVILQKCRAEGLDIKNHMSTLSAGLEATVREWFNEVASTSAIETAEHVDLTKARAEASRRRRRKPKKPPEPEAPPPAPVEPEPAAEAEPAEEAPAAELPPAEEPPAAPEPLEDPASPAEETVVEAESPKAKAKPRAKPKPKAKKPKKPPAAEPVRPAGPQVVPKPAALKGPRVVRVEKPDFVRAPAPKRPAPLTGKGLGLTIGEKGHKQPTPEPIDAGERGKKKTKRRSPRRRSGRSADSGEKIKEWRETDLQERSERLAAAAGGIRRHRASMGKQLASSMQIHTGPVEIDEPITIKSLSSATGIKSAEMIKNLMARDIMATVNQVIDRDTAEMAVADYGIELVVRWDKTAEEQLLEKEQARQKGEMLPRAPVVTFLGHVDHGKTSLLDHIRQTSVVEGEAGGITQHIGAYRYDKDDKHVVFLDTPGHEAFTAMRARGANMTDVVVLVVAADDGVMPQTVEAINHAKVAEVPIVVALNKIDISNANVQRAMGQLAEHDLQPREWGGDVEVIQTSAETGQGIDNLVETLSLEAELLELKAEIDAPPTGFVIESEIKPGLGTVARLLVRNGTLKVGDILLAGRGFGRVRQMTDDRGRTVTQAGPSTPVEVSGLDEPPEAGDHFYVVGSLDKARQVAEDRRQQARIESLAAAPQHSLQEMLDRIEAGQSNELALIIKADVQGSVEAIKGALEKLGTDEVKVNILHAVVGGISTSDVALAEASDAIIIGFNTVPDAAARQQAEAKGVDIRLYRVIYDITGDVRKALEEGLQPEIREETLGRAEVRQVFKISRVGTVAGCYVTDGAVNRNAKVRITRDNIVIGDERSLESLRRFKEDVRDVRAGMECGLKIAEYDDVKEGDILEFYRKVEVARKL